ncbi:hypothetical protein BB559_005145 [Furculomyces boomerangus]|uniref:Chorismate mutase n=1 Tax=Furculomyces boomerangus TaxID=61424 RepID=A0A2T9YAE9_9FUNG|nr:hypothetical protein BB559_007415 [Furculomyces boomerangus]PVU88048.1 hypothetical protein BB559_005757 [Furculomyces boomerangus]PVU89313.1 hypothetical protein BB559_005145 [Furculomyces boomerangus]
MSLDLLQPGILDLNSLRNVLIRLEDTIIFCIAERAQFHTNDLIYQPDGLGFKDGFSGTFLDWFLEQIETVHAKVRRYQSPDEYPFTKNIPAPILDALEYPSVLKPNNINVNDQIKSIYIDFVVPQICESGDDKNYGSAATRDIECLQALSRRIHYGKFVAESKFLDPKYHDTYVKLIKDHDRDAIMALLTNEQVEQKLLERLRKKAMIYGQDFEANTMNPLVQPQSGNVTDGRNVKINCDLVVELYRKHVIPLTKVVEVEYLMQRLD